MPNAKSATKEFYCIKFNIEKMDNELIQKMNSLIEKPAGKKAVRFLLNSLGAFPFVGGTISASASLWGEIEQQKFNEVLTSWATKTDNEINEILFTLDKLLETPTRAKFSLLIGEIMGITLQIYFYFGLEIKYQWY